VFKKWVPSTNPNRSVTTTSLFIIGLWDQRHPNGL
jgi:hypothetical protein